MPSLLVTAALTASALLPLPPLLPATPDPAAQPPAQASVSAAVDAPDGRLRRGCRDYALTYAVTVPDGDWSLDLSTRDRRGKGVSAQSLLGPNDAESGVLPFRLCRRATVPGLFTVTGVLTWYDGDQQTTASVGDTFRLRRPRR
ncbi:hypothetical protein [Nocardioides zeicaulis]|uniref:Serine/threonine protein kinase n=1 Tax=Nocardioides zeicaulis TaxID=1776857 RepID=A0ABV6E502_9ACTN